MYIWVSVMSLCVDSRKGNSFRGREEKSLPALNLPGIPGLFLPRAELKIVWAKHFWHFWSLAGMKLLTGPRVFATFNQGWVLLIFRIFYSEMPCQFLCPVLISRILWGLLLRVSEPQGSGGTPGWLLLLYKRFVRGNTNTWADRMGSSGPWGKARIYCRL